MGMSMLTVIHSATLGRRDTNEMSFGRTEWGLILRQHGLLSAHALLAELALMLSALVLLGVIVALWLWPVPPQSGAVLLQWAGTVSLGVGAFRLFRSALLGLQRETWLDYHNGRMLQVRRSALGRTNVVSKIPLSALESFYIFRVRQAGRASHLYARIKNGADAIYVGSGSERALELVHSQLAQGSANCLTPAQGRR